MGFMQIYMENRKLVQILETIKTFMVGMHNKDGENRSVPICLGILMSDVLIINNTMSDLGPLRTLLQE